MADFSVAAKPVARPQNPNFSSGPCAKRPGFSLAALEGAALGRSHRAKGPKAKLAEVISLSAQILGLPEGWRLGIVPASDTGAIEMALWSMLGARTCWPMKVFPKPGRPTWSNSSNCPMPA